MPFLVSREPSEFSNLKKEAILGKKANSRNSYTQEQILLDDGGSFQNQNGETYCEEASERISLKASKSYRLHLELF